MKLALFTPYGLLSRESGLLYLVANFLQKNGADVVQLRCDGAQPACSRDKLHPGGRTPFSCSECMSEQRALTQWAGVKTKELSSFIVAEDVLKSAQWISSVKSADLFNVEFRGNNLWGVCSAEFLSRWGLEAGQEMSVQHEDNLRTLYITYVQTCLAAESFVSTWSPTLSLVASPSDQATQAYITQARKAGSEVALFSYQSVDDSIVVGSLSSAESYTTKLILDGITSMRNEPRTWAPEVTAVVHELLTFIGYEPDRVL